MIQLNLPLSATALREGAEFLTKLSQLADVIRDEVRGPTTLGQLCYTVDLAPENQEALAQAEADAVRSTSEPLVTSAPDPQDAITAAANACLPPQFETVVIGHERNPEYTGELAGWDPAALEQSGWDVPGLLAAGYLREVTEQRPLAAAPSVLPPPAPAAPVPAAPDTFSTVELDVDGLPWDARIHSNAAERKAATGKWKTRKNLAPGYKEQIEAELRLAMGTTANSSAPVPSPAAPSAPTAAPQPPAPAAPGAAPGPSAGGMTFPQFVQWAMGHTKAGRCNQTDVQLAVQGVGLKDVPALSQNVPKIPEVVAALKASKGLE